MARRLVQPVVDADHALERGQRGVEPVARRARRCTGLPAIVISALIWPAPGVAISSARHEIGTWPSTSGAPRTRLLPAAELAAVAPGPAGGARRSTTRPGSANIEPPGRSRLPGEDVQRRRPATTRACRTPGCRCRCGRRPPRAARRRARGRARRIVSAGSAQVSATASGVKARASRADLVDAVDAAARWPRSTRPSANSTCDHRQQQERRRCRAGSGTHSSARSAVPVRRGSITTTLPPRARIASRRAEQVGAASRLPCDACGLAPMHEQVVGAVEVGHRERPTCRRTAARRRRSSATGRRCPPSRASGMPRHRRRTRPT